MYSTNACAGCRSQPNELSFGVASSRETALQAIQEALTLYPLNIVGALQSGSPCYRYCGFNPLMNCPSGCVVAKDRHAGYPIGVSLVPSGFNDSFAEWFVGL